MKEELLKKIQDKTMKAAVIGLGYVGLPLATQIATKGYNVVGVDVQQSKVDMINKGQNYISDIDDKKFKEVIDSKKLVATTKFEEINKADFIAICVPTPLDEHQQPDISYIQYSVTELAKNIKKGTMVVLESTTYPGTTEELVRPILEEISGLKCNEDFYLGFSPERVDPGNVHYKTNNTPKIIGAIGEEANECISEVYKHILESEVYTVSSPAVAEMEKILENTYRNINIGLVNEMAIICDKMGISIWEVIDAAKTKPYGFQAFYPGPGLGGHCIPLDPYYLTWKAREYDYHTKLIETSGEINIYMPQYILERSSKILNDRKIALKGAKILICGIAYKADIDDYRESPSLRVIENFEKYGSIVESYDPYIKSFKYKNKTYECKQEITSEYVKEFDLIVITTDHKKVDYSMIQKNAQKIFDTKNAMKSITVRNNIELL